MTKLTTPVRRQADTIPATWGIKSQLIISLYPRGIIGIRESGRRSSSEVMFDSSELYVEGIRRRIAKAKAEKKKARLARRSSN